MKHIVAFSGGLASAVTAGIILSENNKEDVILLFHDTKTEPVDNNRFRQDLAKHFNHPITVDSDGRDIWQLFNDEGMLGNGRNTMCSRILKQKRSLNYMVKNQPAILYVGFTVDEWRRAQRTYARYNQKKIAVKFPLIENKITKTECQHRVMNCWRLKPPQMYEWASHANCVPCIKGKKAYWGLIYMFERQAWERASQAEKEFGHTIFTEAGSLKDELQNCLRLAQKYLEKKNQAENQNELFEFPCECAV